MYAYDGTGRRDPFVLMGIEEAMDAPRRGGAPLLPSRGGGRSEPLPSDASRPFRTGVPVFRATRNPQLPLRSGTPGLQASVRPPFGVPNLRRNVCPHFYMTGGHGAIPIHAPHLLKALSRQESNISRCQLRGGVHLEQGYVSDVCLSARFNQCVFYEDELARH